MRQLSSHQKGFTIIELLIATTVFSVMLLVATTGLVQIGRVYYKGITTSKTQEITRGIVNEIASSIQVGGKGDTDIAAGPALATGEQAFCVGDVRYSYALDRQVKADNNLPDQGKHGIWLDIKKRSDPCTALSLTPAIPGDASTDPDPEALSKRRELLGANMRVTQFTIAQPNPTNPNYVNVSVGVVYGDRDLSPGGQCVGGLSGGQFCATSALSTFVKKRL